MAAQEAVKSADRKRMLGSGFVIPEETWLSAIAEVKEASLATWLDNL